MSATVLVAELRAGMEMTVVPLSIVADAALLVPGEKPSPAMPTVACGITCPALRAIVGEARIVRLAD